MLYLARLLATEGAANGHVAKTPRARRRPTWLARTERTPVRTRSPPLPPRRLDRRPADRLHRERFPSIPKRSSAAASMESSSRPSRRPRTATPPGPKRAPTSNEGRAALTRTCAPARTRRCQLCQLSLGAAERMRSFRRRACDSRTACAEGDRTDGADSLRAGLANAHLRSGAPATPRPSRSPAISDRSPPP